MNIKGRLLHLAQLGMKDRQTGRTTRLIALAKEIGGIFVTHNQAAADHAVRNNPGLVARSMETNLEGYLGPFVMDHFAIETMFVKAANKIDEVESTNQKLVSKIEYLEERNKEDTRLFEQTINHAAETRAVLVKYINELSEAGFGVKAEEILDQHFHMKRKTKEAQND